MCVCMQVYVCVRVCQACKSLCTHKNLKLTMLARAVVQRRGRAKHPPCEATSPPYGCVTEGGNVYATLARRQRRGA